MKKIFLALCVLSLVATSSLASAQATGRFYFSESPISIPAQSEFSINIFVASPIPLNAYRAIVIYDPQYAEFLGSNDSTSIVAFWQTRPSVVSPGKIEFAGGNPEEFSGNNGKVITLRFRALKEGISTLSLEKTDAYIADGKGSAMQLQESTPISFTVTPPSGVVAESKALTSDTMPPEIEYISLITDPLDPQNKLISFLVKDSESGFKDASARALKWFAWGNWEPIENPSQIPKNAWAIEFKAYDNAGNLTAQTLYQWPQFFTTVFPIFVFAGALLIVAAMYLSRKRKNIYRTNI